MCSSSFQVFDKAVSQQLSAVLDKWKGKTHWHMFYFIIFFQQYQETFIKTFLDDLSSIQVWSIKTCYFTWCFLVICRYWQPCEETSECSGDLECVRRPGGRWGHLKVIMVLAKKGCRRWWRFESYNVLAKKVMDGEGNLQWRLSFEKSNGGCGR